MIKGVYFTGAVLIAFSSAGFAATANATFGFTPIGTISANNGGDILAATAITMPGIEVVNTVPPTNLGSANDRFCTGTNAATCVALASNVTLSPLTIPLMTGAVSLPNFLSFSSSTTPTNRYTFSAAAEHTMTLPVFPARVKMSGRAGAGSAAQSTLRYSRSTRGAARARGSASR